MQPSDYYELDLKINPDLEDVLSEYFFSNFECDGVVLYEETYKDLERISTTEGTLRIFLKNTGLDEVKISIDNLKNNFKQADKLNSQFVIIIGSEEKDTDIITVKDNHTKESYKLNKDEIIDFLDNNLD